MDCQAGVRWFCRPLCYWFFFITQVKWPYLNPIANSLLLFTNKFPFFKRPELYNRWGDGNKNEWITKSIAFPLSLLGHFLYPINRKFKQVYFMTCSKGFFSLFHQCTLVCKSYDCMCVLEQRINTSFRLWFSGWYGFEMGQILYMCWRSEKWF